MADAERGGEARSRRADDGQLVGTVQVILAVPPNQPHRGGSPSCSFRSARRRGVAQLLMEGAEAEARAVGKSLLVLDTVTGDPAERLYERLGWTRSGSARLRRHLPATFDVC